MPRIREVSVGDYHVPMAPPRPPRAGSAGARGVLGVEISRSGAGALLGGARGARVVLHWSRGVGRAALRPFPPELGGGECGECCFVSGATAAQVLRAGRDPLRVDRPTFDALCAAAAAHPARSAMPPRFGADVAHHVAEFLQPEDRRAAAAAGLDRDAGFAHAERIFRKRARFEELLDSRPPWDLCPEIEELAETGCLEANSAQGLVGIAARHPGRGAELRLLLRLRAPVPSPRTQGATAEAVARRGDAEGLRLLLRAWAGEPELPRALQRVLRGRGLSLDVLRVLQEADGLPPSAVGDRVASLGTAARFAGAPELQLWAELPQAFRESRKCYVELLLQRVGAHTAPASVMAAVQAAEPGSDFGPAFAADLLTRVLSGPAAGAFGPQNICDIALLARGAAAHALTMARPAPHLADAAAVAALARLPPQSDECLRRAGHFAVVGRRSAAAALLPALAALHARPGLHGPFAAAVGRALFHAAGLRAQRACEQQPDGVDAVWRLVKAHAGGALLPAVSLGARLNLLCSALGASAAPRCAAVAMEIGRGLQQGDFDGRSEFAEDVAERWARSFAGSGFAYPHPCSELLPVLRDRCGLRFDTAAVAHALFRGVCAATWSGAPGASALERFLREFLADELHLVVRSSLLQQAPEAAALLFRAAERAWTPDMRTRCLRAGARSPDHALQRAHAATAYAVALGVHHADLAELLSSALGDSGPGPVLFAAAKAAAEQPRPPWPRGSWGPAKAYAATRPCRSSVPEGGFDFMRHLLQLGPDPRAEEPPAEVVACALRLCAFSSGGAIPDELEAVAFSETHLLQLLGSSCEPDYQVVLAVFGKTGPPYSPGFVRETLDAYTRSRSCGAQAGAASRFLSALRARAGGLSTPVHLLHRAHGAAPPPYGLCEVVRAGFGPAAPDVLDWALETAAEVGWGGEAEARERARVWEHALLWPGFEAALRAHRQRCGCESPDEAARHGHLACLFCGLQDLPPRAAWGAMQRVLRQSDLRPRVVAICRAVPLLLEAGLRVRRDWGPEPPAGLLPAIAGMMLGADPPPSARCWEAAVVGPACSHASTEGVRDAELELAVRRMPHSSCSAEVLDVASRDWRAVRRLAERAAGSEPSARALREVVARVLDRERRAPGTADEWLVGVFAGELRGEALRGGAGRAPPPFRRKWAWAPPLRAAAEAGVPAPSAAAVKAALGALRDALQADSGAARTCLAAGARWVHAAAAVVRDRSCIAWLLDRGEFPGALVAAQAGLWSSLEAGKLTALHVAAAAGNMEAVSALLAVWDPDQRGAPTVRSPHVDDGLSPAQLFAANARRDAGRFWEVWGQFETETRHGRSLAHYAATNACPRVLELLLQKDPAALEKRTWPEGHSLLHWASMAGSMPCWELLVAKGCPVVRDASGRPPTWRV